MIDNLVTIDRAAVQSMTSARADRIYLPYENTGDVCYHAGAMIADYIGQRVKHPDTVEGERQFSDDCTRTLNSSKITAYLTLKPAYAVTLAGLYIEVTTPDGTHLQRMIYTPSGNEIAADILTDYLQAGAPGLRADYRKSYERQHWQFMRRAILSGGAGLRAELREFCQAFASAVRAGMTPEQIIAAITD